MKRKCISQRPFQVAHNPTSQNLRTARKKSHIETRERIKIKKEADQKKKNKKKKTKGKSAISYFWKEDTVRVIWTFSCMAIGAEVFS